MAAEIEVHADTLETALEEAAAELAVPVDLVGYQVVEAERAGLLRRKSRGVSIRAWAARADDEAETAEPDVPGELAEGEAVAPAEQVGPPVQIDEDDIVETVLDGMDEILDVLDLDADSEAYFDPEGNVVVEITGPDPGPIIGRRGATLEAIQYILSRVASRRAGARIRVVADAEGYRARRKDALTDLAVRTARRAAQSRRSVTLRPMTPSERRIVHMALAGDSAVDTYSEGDEPDRRVVIAPK